MARRSFTALILIAICFTSYGQKPDFKVLAFYDRSDDTEELRSLFSELSDHHNFTFDETKDWTNLNDTLLQNYQVLMWIGAAPKTKTQFAVFEKYMKNDGRWIGIQTGIYAGAQSRTILTASQDRLVVTVGHPVAQNIPAFLSVTASDHLAWTNEMLNMVYLDLAYDHRALGDYYRRILFGDALLWIGEKLVPKRKATAANDNLPEMIAVKGGTFTMGDDAGDKDEKPARSVTVSDFNIAKTETTIAQWRNFCLSTGTSMPEASWFQQDEQHPVVNVSWDHAIAYCKWLSQLTGKNYRLPTEAEWEFAARGGTKTKGFPYSGGKNADSVAWLAHKTEGTMPVAQKAPNELGLYDMTGNVWEWCSDWYDTSKRFYTTRGGAWDIGLRNNRIAYRNPLAPTSRNHNKGFRVACD